jgi:hypothetical protein
MVDLLQLILLVNIYYFLVTLLAMVLKMEALKPL